MSTEPVEVGQEIVPSVAGAAPPSARMDSFIKPAAPVEQIRNAFQEYQGLCESLLVEDDHQTIGNRRFKKKSAYRKLAVAFNVTVELVERVYERNDAGRIIRAEVVARAIAPNGRAMDGLGACDLFEKCCDVETCRNKSQYHSHCKVGCDGTIHFSNPQHDLPATAATRATNRACADLFGMGEVSAEEITDRGHAEPAAPKLSIRERLAALPEGAADAFTAFLDSEGKSRVPREWSPDDTKAVERWLGDAEKGKIKFGQESGGEAPERDESTRETDSGGEEGAETSSDVETGGETDPDVDREADDAAAEIAAVKEMKVDEVRAELESLDLDQVGNADTIRKRLVLARLRVKVGAIENAAPEGGAE